MREVAVTEAKDKLGALLDSVSKGEEVVITRDGKPVARLVPERSERNRMAARAAVARVRARVRSRREAASLSTSYWPIATKVGGERRPRRFGRSRMADGRRAF